jgi:hypothetical protein
MSRQDTGLWLVALLLAPALVTAGLWSSGPSQALGAGIIVLLLDLFVLVVAKMMKESGEEKP